MSSKQPPEGSAGTVYLPRAQVPRIRSTPRMPRATETPLAGDPQSVGVSPSQHPTVVDGQVVGEPPVIASHGSAGARSTPGRSAESIEERLPSDLAGYEVCELLGRGGMGEVLLARDEMIGREVAIKRMRRVDPPPEAETRFLREAKIQARLQHPAIVPVHELGRDADGRPYFTMKRLAGQTLEQLRGEPPPRR